MHFRISGLELDIDQIPESIRTRLISARAFDAKGMMLDADVVDGQLLEPVLRRLFDNTLVGFYTCTMQNLDAMRQEWIVIPTNSNTRSLVMYAGSVCSWGTTW